VFVGAKEGRVPDLLNKGLPWREWVFDEGIMF
jgi:hypothetical protein